MLLWEGNEIGKSVGVGGNQRGSHSNQERTSILETRRVGGMRWGTNIGGKISVHQ